MVEAVLPGAHMSQSHPQTTLWQTAAQPDTQSGGQVVDSDSCPRFVGYFWEFSLPRWNFPSSVGIFPVPWEFALPSGNFPSLVGICPSLWEFFPVLWEFFSVPWEFFPRFVVLCGNFSRSVGMFPRFVGILWECSLSRGSFSPSQEFWPRPDRQTPLRVYIY